MNGMRRDFAVAVFVAMVAVAVTIAGPASGVAPAQDSATDGNATSGETLAGAFAAHGSDLDGTLERRELAAALERVDGDAATAAVLAERRLTAERRAEALAARHDRLRAEREAGDLPANAYRVETARLSARAHGLEAFLSVVVNESQALPAAVRSTYGLDGAALNRSLTRVAAADPGDPFELSDADASRPPDADFASARHATERAVTDVERRQAELSEFLDALADTGTDEAVLECGRVRLAASRDATSRSRAALSANESAAAEVALLEGSTTLRSAFACLADAENVPAPSDGEFRFEGDDYEWNGTEWKASDRDDVTWSDTEYNNTGSDREWDRTRTPTPTPKPTPTYPGTWTRHGESSSETSTNYPTPTKADG